MLDETQQLKSNVQHIKEIVSRQQSLSGQSGITSMIDIREVVRDALTIHAGALKRSSVCVLEDHEKDLVWQGDRSKLAQIILNLVVNAEEALVCSSALERLLSIRTFSGTDGSVEIRISDNGIGMTPETMGKLFTYGFTTKSSGHGFGLHSSALAAQELHGSLRAFSDGPDLGITFFLTLPSAVTASVA